MKSSTNLKISERGYFQEQKCNFSPVLNLVRIFLEIKVKLMKHETTDVQV